MLVAHLPRDSNLGRARLGDDVDWTLTDHLLAAVFDSLQVLAWQNANMGARSPSSRPKPLPRPGVEDTATKTTGTALPLAEIDRILGRTPAEEEVSVDGS